MKKLGNKLLGLLPKGRHAVIGVPFFWMLLFFLLPFAIIVKISFSERAIANAMG